MTKRRITRSVERVVTDLRIDLPTNSLVAHAVDQYGPGKATVGSYDGSVMPDDQPKEVRAAVETLVAWAEGWADEQ